VGCTYAEVSPYFFMLVVLVTLAGFGNIYAPVLLTK
jgi:hypothetical protein